MIKELIKEVYNKKYFKNFKYRPHAYNLIMFTTLSGMYRVNIQFNNKKGILYNMWIEKRMKVKNTYVYINLKTLYSTNKEPNMEYIRKNIKFLEA